MFRWLSRACWWLRYRFVRGHRYNVIFTDLRPRYYDIDEIMLWANFRLLERYFEEERALQWWHGNANDNFELWCQGKAKLDHDPRAQDDCPHAASGENCYFADGEKHDHATARLLDLYEWWKWRKQIDYTGPWDKNLGFTDQEAFVFEMALEEWEDQQLALLMKLRRGLWT